MTQQIPTAVLRRDHRPMLAWLATAAVTLISLPVHLFLAFMFAIASSRYDTTGQGAPFKNCSSEANCSDPNYAWMLGTGILMVLLWLVAAQVGQLVWGRRPRVIRVVSLLVFSAVLTAAGGVILFYLSALRSASFLY